MRRLAWIPCLLMFGACSGSSPAGPSPVIPTPAPPPTPSTPPAPAPTPAPTPEPAPASTVLRRTMFRGLNGHSASGSARIVREGGRHTLELADDFRLDSGHTDVYLSRRADGIEGARNLGELRSLTGAQSYSMPDDGGAYGHVVLWCRPFQVPIGSGELR